MSSLGSLNIQLSLDTVQFQQSLSKSDHQTQKFVKNFTVDMDKARNSARQFADRTTEYLGNIERAAKNINTATKWEFRFNNIDRVKNLAISFIEIADKSTELSNKLKLVTENEVQHAQAMSAVYDISMKTAQSTQAVSAIYSSFSQNAKELGINQQQVAGVTETISKAVAISGASATEAQNALTQFSQTLLMGKMRSQEYNSIMTQTPAVLQAIARGLGVTMGELKKMSDDGKLTAEKMIEGLEKSKASVDALYSKTATTISGAMQNLKTATQKWVGELDTSIGVSDKAVKATQLLASHLDELAKIAFTVGVAYGSWKIGAVIQDQYNGIKATQAETNAIHQKLSVSAQEKQATFQAQLATYQNIQAKQADVVATQAQIQAEQAKLRILALSAQSYAERRIIQTELQALDRISAELTQKQTFLDQQQAVAKRALSVAYRENAFAQSAFAASTQASGVAMTAFRTIAAGVKAEMNALKVAMLSNPIMLGLTALTTAGSLLYMFATSTDEATEASLRYADAIDQVRTNLEQMSSVQITAEMVKVKQSIEAQEDALAKLRQEQERLANSAKTTSEVIYDAFGGSYEVVKSAEELSRTNDELALKTAEVENAQNKLNQSLEWLSDLQAHQPVADLKEQFSALFPQVEESQIKIDGLNLSIGNFSIALPEASANALEFAKSISSIASVAMQAAVAVANLNNLSVNPLSDKAQSMIERQKRQIAINNAKTPEEARRLKAEDAAINAGFKKGTADYDAVYNNSYELFKSQDGKNERNKAKKGKSKGKGAKTDYVKQYTDQLTQMQQRLAELRANAKDIALFGQSSQYQEVNKLTQDIAANGEKYANFGKEGLAKLKEMATQIDSANQQVAISQFTFDNTEKLEAMEFELTLLGRTRQEQELMQYNHQLDLEAAKLKIGMTEENIAKLDEEIAKLKERRAEIQQQNEEARGSAMLGFQQGMQTIEDQVSNVAGNISNLTVSAFGTMSDALTDFVMTGKADFSAMAKSIIRDIVQMTVRMLFFRAISSAFGGFSSVSIGNSPIAGAATDMLPWFDSGGYTGDGGKYQPAGIVHRGEYVITKEATARLGRGFLDQLNYGAVRRGFANGGGVGVQRVYSDNYSKFNSAGRVDKNVVVNIHNHTNAQVETKQNHDGGIDIIIKQIENKIARDINNRQGAVYRATQSSFGLRSVGV